MKRLVVTLAALLMLLGLTAQGIVAQDASPAAGGTPAAPLLDALGYPTLPIGFDGTAVTAPAQVDAGRYMVDISNTAGAPIQVLSFLGATDDLSTDDIVAGLQSADPNQGPPAVYYQTKVVEVATDLPGVITLDAGDYVLLAIGSDGPPAVTTLTVTGDLPTYDDIPDAVHVDLHEMVIDMPDTVPAGDHIYQIENTGSMPHMFEVMKINGPITDEELMNALMLEAGAPGATPVSSGSVSDPATFIPMIGTGAFANGLPQLVEGNLEPGTYVALCFVDGPGDVGVHAMLGMYKVFTVE